MYKCDENFLPSGPIVLTVTSGSAILAWNYTDTNQNGFNIEKSIDGNTYSILQTLTDFRIRNYIDNAVSSGNTYWYRLNAYNNYGTASYYSNIVNITFSGSTPSPQPIAPVSGHLLADIDGYTPADVDITNADILSSYSGVVDLNYNSYTFLSATDCTELTTLYCNANSLTTLDISGNTALINLECSYNYLTELDVSTNSALQTLYCNTNSLTSLNVSGCTALTLLAIADNFSLTSLDINSCTALTTLFCDNNLLTSLDVSNNTALTYLSCDSNPLTQTAIDNILSAFVVNGQIGGTVFLSDAPSSTGSGSDYDTLVNSRGWLVIY